MSEPFLLLSCCAPCSCAVIAKLAEAGENFAVVFYNPNIRPQEEYLKRMEENRRVCRIYNVEFIELEYDNDRWCMLTRGLENEPERGKRICVSKGSWNLQKAEAIRPSPQFWACPAIKIWNRLTLPQRKLLPRPA